MQRRRGGCLFVIKGCMAFEIVFCGTPQFAVPSLQALHQHPDFRVAQVFTQPDRPSGRGKKLKPSPVKLKALELGLNVATPEKVSTAEIVEDIRSKKYDVGVVVAYGQLLSEDFLKAFKFGCVNVHSSLLPRWRGAAPMQRAIMAGDKQTGVSLQKVVKKLDAGDVIAETKMELPIEMGATELYNDLSLKGANLLIDHLQDYMEGLIEPNAQDESKVTYAKKILKEEGLINWHQDCLSVHNHIRGLDMGGPYAFTTYKNKTLKIHKSLPQQNDVKQTPGLITEVSKDEITVACQSGELILQVVQPESKARMSVADFIRGYHVQQGDRFE